MEEKSKIKASFDSWLFFNICYENWEIYTLLLLFYLLSLDMNKSTKYTLDIEKKRKFRNTWVNLWPSLWKCKIFHFVSIQ